MQDWNLQDSVLAQISLIQEAGGACPGVVDQPAELPGAGVHDLPAQQTRPGGAAERRSAGTETCEF